MEKTSEIKKKWVKIYPTYIDKGLKTSEGRKVNKNIAVENPQLKEIFGVCAEVLKLDSKAEFVYYLFYCKFIT